jgi:hypothetical protein
MSSTARRLQPLALVALLAGALATAAALAQTAAPPAEAVPAVGESPAPAAPAPPARHAPHQQRRASVDDQVRRLTADLRLNDTQQAAVKGILEQRRQETLRMMRSGSGGDAVGRLQMLQASTVERIRAVLTEEQRNRYHPLDERPQQTLQPSVADWMKATTAHREETDRKEK